MVVWIQKKQPLTAKGMIGPHIGRFAGVIPVGDARFLQTAEDSLKVVCPNMKAQVVAVKRDE